MYTHYPDLCKASPRGFDPEAVDPGRQGLLGMRERVELLGGRLSVESAPGQGTRVQVRLPIGVAA
jgi:signal transduction histidine kinase